MKKNKASVVDAVLGQVSIDTSFQIHRKLYCGDICINKNKDKNSYTIYVKSVYGVKFIKLVIDTDPETWFMRLRIYHDWCSYQYEEDTKSGKKTNKEEKPLKTILINELSNFIEKDEIKYIINYFSEASRNNYKYFRDNLSVLHKGKKSFWNYLKYWFKWPRKRPI